MVPRAKRLPIVGNLFELRRDRVLFYEKLRKTLGDTVRFDAMGRELILLSDPDDIRTVLVERAYDFHKSLGYKTLEVALGSGLVTSEDDLHKKQRKMLAPFFTPRQIASYADALVAACDEHQAAWTDGAQLDVVEAMSLMTLDGVGRTLFGAQLGAQERELTAAFATANQWLAEELFRLVHLPLWVPLPRHVSFRRALQRIEELLNALIAARRAGGGADMLSVLTAARAEDGAGMSDRQLRDETLTLMFAGHETTALALAWTLYLLARHPEQRHRLTEEIDPLLAGRPPGLADLQRLPYCAAVVKEAMRLYPPAPLVGRRAKTEVALRRCTLAPEAHVVCSIYGVQHRDDLWPDPERFDPERFLGDGRVPEGAYMPFGLGPRVCIGNHFALMEAQLMLAHLVQRVQLDLVSPAPLGLRTLVTLHPDAPMVMRVARRERLAGAAA